MHAGQGSDPLFQAGVGSLLDDRRLKRVFLVTDRIGEPAEPQVVSLVERTTHHDFYKITVSQGIVIDPRHPGKATVFALVLDPADLEPFGTRLRDTFKDRVEDNEIDPAIAMQLADIGQVVSLPPRPVAEVTILSSTMALRVQPGSPQELEPGRPGFFRVRAGPADAGAGTAAHRRRSWPGTATTRPSSPGRRGPSPRGRRPRRRPTGDIGNKGPRSGTSQLPGPPARGEARPRRTPGSWCWSGSPSLARASPGTRRPRTIRAVPCQPNLASGRSPVTPGAEAVKSDGRVLEVARPAGETRLASPVRFGESWQTLLAVPVDAVVVFERRPTETA